VLTEAVRRNPAQRGALDEVEKAHGDVLELFFQVFDKGVLDDAEGRQIDFRNTIIILTSNAASSQMMQACLNKPAAEMPSPQQLAEIIRPQLMKHLPAFRAPDGGAVLSDRRRGAGAHHPPQARADPAPHRPEPRARFDYDDALVDAVLARCTEVDSGARNVDTILNGTLLPEIADSVLAKWPKAARSRASR
jgi:type VI secretion system protein VasG